MATCFPKFAKLFGAAHILWQMNMAFMLYFYPERTGAGEWVSSGSNYHQYEQANWTLASLYLSIAALGVVALTKPPKMQGCIYVFSAYWLCVIFYYIHDIIGAYWWQQNLGFQWSPQISASQFKFSSANDINPQTQSGTASGSGGLTAWAGYNFASGTLMVQGQFMSWILLAASIFAFSQVWDVAYPEGEELMKNKPNHKCPMVCKIVGMIQVVIIFLAVLMYFFWPEYSIFEPGFDHAYRWMYKRWASQARTYYADRVQYTDSSWESRISSWETKDWDAVTHNSNVYDSFLDTWVVKIGNRLGAFVFIGIVAMWKDGEQLRYWLAFFVLNIHLDFQVMFGVWIYKNDTMAKWMGFIMHFIFFCLNVFCAMKIHKQVEPKAGSNQITGMA